MKFWELVEGDRFKRVGREDEHWIQVADGSRSKPERAPYVSTEDDGDVYAHPDDPVIVQLPRPFGF